MCQILPTWGGQSCPGQQLWQSEAMEAQEQPPALCSILLCPQPPPAGAVTAASPEGSWGGSRTSASQGCADSDGLRGCQGTPPSLCCCPPPEVPGVKASPPWGCPRAALSSFALHLEQPRHQKGRLRAPLGGLGQGQSSALAGVGAQQLGPMGPGTGGNAAAGVGWIGWAGRAAPHVGGHLVESSLGTFCPQHHPGEGLSVLWLCSSSPN